MNEAETRIDLIDPALKASGWGVVEGSRIRAEYLISPGRIQGGGKKSTAEKADYVLVFRNTRLAVIEAKKASLPVTEGLGQAKRYAGKLQIRFAISTNGHGIHCVDMLTGIETALAAYPTPEDLWALTFTKPDDWRDRFTAIAPREKGGDWSLRYYQANAINAVLESLAAGNPRILLTLATGTGKTTIAFQIAWKLFEAKLNLSGKPTRRPRILFLADRNTLADQAFNDFTSFAAFPEGALVRITPEDIAKKGKAILNGSVFFTIFQTFMTGKDTEGNDAPNFEGYDPDFFDFIVIDECHRGGANDESTWRAILTYFKPAVQLGLTATPKRTINADTYAYFGEPVYVYSLKEGINDGFLTPFRLQQIASTLDSYIYAPDDDVIAGEVDESRVYTEAEFNRVIEIKERERARVQTFMGMINQKEKTIVFCATQKHALAVRDLINEMKTSANPHYCERVTADDGKIGEDNLKAFRNNEKTIPTILTTSQKLSTGVDARNIRNIVLMRPVNSMIEFKQIIGRGTRLYEGKEYFTIYDFVKAYERFNDPEWDGELPEPEEKGSRKPKGEEPQEEITEPPVIGDDFNDNEEDGASPAMLQIKLADGKQRQIQHISATMFYNVDGKPISAADFLKNLYGDVPVFFKNEDELRALWREPAARKALLNGLAEKGYGAEQLSAMRRAINAEKSDIFDVLAYVAFSLPPISREERVADCKEHALDSFGSKLQTFLEFVLGQYVVQGIDELDDGKLGDLIALRYGSVTDAQSQIGTIADIRAAFLGIQKRLF